MFSLRMLSLSLSERECVLITKKKQRPSKQQGDACEEEASWKQK